MHPHLLANCFGQNRGEIGQNENLASPKAFDLLPLCAVGSHLVESWAYFKTTILTLIGHHFEIVALVRNYGKHVSGIFHISETS